MILEKQTEANVQQTGEIQDSIGMSLDLDSAQILMQMLSKNLYSDAIGSTIRETASNALDAHRRAGTDKPIVVSFGVNASNNYEFSVEDFGIGLDAEDVKNIISKYGKSTKRNSATELGMMGLGFKAPLAYSSSFYFVCRKDGIERKYMMYEGEDTNTIDLLYEKSTTECNGVKVIVPVEYYDRNDFVTKISEQLAYFENVYFDVKDFDNNFSIIRSEHFQWSPIAKDHKLHVCLDNVYYPLEFDKLGLDNYINFPVALRFSLTDGIFPTPNRESIRYTKEAKQIILNKIELVANYFVEKYNESVEETDDFFQVYDYFRSENRYLKSFKTLDIAIVKKFATIQMEKPKLKGVTVLDLEHLCKNHSEYILNEYKKRYKIENSRFKENKTSWSQSFTVSNARDYAKDNAIVFLFNDRVSGNMKDYLKEKYPAKSWRIPTILLKKAAPYKLGGPNKSSGTRYSEYNTYYDILKLSKLPKNKWRQAIQEFQSIVKYITSTFTNLDTVVIPQDWLDARKKTKVVISKAGSGVRRVKLKGEISMKILEKLERYVDGKNTKQVPAVMSLETAHQNKHLSVYGKSEDYAKMDKLFTAFKNKDLVKFMIVSDRELKNLENVELHNLMPINKFMEGKNKPFKRIATAFLIKKLMDENRYAFEKLHHLASVSSELQGKMFKLYEYKSRHFHHGSEGIYDAIIDVANEHKLFDMEIYDDYLEIKETLEKLPFINAILEHISNYRPEGLKQVIIDQFKYYRKKLNYTNYKLTEETLISPIESEEVIEELYID